MLRIYALIAGIAAREAGKMQPGFILDAFFVKRKYDEALAGRRW